MEIAGEPGPLLAAAILAAVVRLDEEAQRQRSLPQERPKQARWVMAGIPRPVQSPFVTRPAPVLGMRELDAAGGSNADA